ncbi:MAG: hypothetical protein ACYCZB_17355 [Acidiphilium sp.]
MKFDKDGSALPPTPAVPMIPRVTSARQMELLQTLAEEVALAIWATSQSTISVDIGFVRNALQSPVNGGAKPSQCGGAKPGHWAGA